MSLRHTVFFTIFATGLWYALPAPAAASPKVDPRLRAAIESSPDQAPISALLVLKESASLRVRTALLARRQPNLQARYQVVYKELRQQTAIAQSDLIDLLQKKVREGSITEFKAYWITNAIYILAAPGEILNLAEYGEIDRIVADVQVEVIEPVATSAAKMQNQGPGANLLAVGARALWDRGLTGKGRLICSFDTGVDGSHPAIADKWRGNYTTNTAACWFDPLGEEYPVDGSGTGHGTHVMGTMVGHSGMDTVGLAPDARWICAAVVDRGKPLGSTLSDILEAFEWAADPDGDPETMDDVPDVVCNSWGIPKGFMDQCDDKFWAAIDNLESLGIVCVFAAGNEGPGSVTLRNPADRASSPTNSFAVGAVDASSPSLPVASFSSRGPSSCNLISKKPEVVAPGVGVRSAAVDGGYKLMSGTSMAAPHVAAAVALFRQYNPELTPEQIKSAILLSAIDIEDPGEDNESGMGFIDLAAALEWLPELTVPEPRVDDVIFRDGANNLFDPGETGNLSVSLRGDVIDGKNLVGYLFTTTPGIQITKDTAYFGLVPLDGSGDNTADPFVISAATGFAPGDTVPFTLTLTGDNIPGYIQREFGLVFGVPYGGEWATLDIGSVAMTVSNFGILGLHNESYIPLGGRGYEVPAGAGNYLYEAGLVIKAGAGPVSDEIRTDGVGRYNGNFKPTLHTGMTLASPGTIGDQESITTFDDSGAAIPLGIMVQQRAAAFSALPGGDCILLEWTIHNISGSTLEDLCVGLFSDWDIPGDHQADLIAVDLDEDLFYQHRGSSTPVVGVALLNFRMSAARFFDNGMAKRGFSEFEKYEAIANGISVPGESQAADWCGFIAAGPHQLADGDSIVVALAVCFGQTTADFYTVATEARNKYLLATGIVEDQSTPPREHELLLYQNYPNPFNPETRIDFVMPADGWVKVAVYDILGRKVKTLEAGYYAAGTHTVVWQGVDDAGRQVASGVYLCRVATKTKFKTRKMILVR